MNDRDKMLRFASVLEVVRDRGLSRIDEVSLALDVCDAVQRFDATFDLGPLAPWEQELLDSSLTPEGWCEQNLNNYGWSNDRIERKIMMIKDLREWSRDRQVWNEDPFAYNPRVMSLVAAKGFVDAVESLRANDLSRLRDKLTGA